MIVLHGRGDSIKPFGKFNQELRIPEMNYLLLNAPSRFLDGYSWYAEPPHKSAGVIRIRERLFQLLNELEEQGWQSENIFLFGFSQGCLISADVGMNYPKKLGGIVGISGYFHFFPRWQHSLNNQNKKTPWLFTHGYKDDILPINDTQFGVEKLKQAGLNVRWVEFEKDHNLVDEEYPIIRQWVKQNLNQLKK